MYYAPGPQCESKGHVGHGDSFVTDENTEASDSPKPLGQGEENQNYNSGHLFLQQMVTGSLLSICPFTREECTEGLWW